MVKKKLNIVRGNSVVSRYCNAQQNQNVSILIGLKVRVVSTVQVVCRCVRTHTSVFKYVCVELCVCRVHIRIKRAFVCVNGASVGQRGCTVGLLWTVALPT